MTRYMPQSSLEVQGVFGRMIACSPTHDTYGRIFEDHTPDAGNMRVQTDKTEQSVSEFTNKTTSSAEP